MESDLPILQYLTYLSSILQETSPPAARCVRRPKNVIRVSFVSVLYPFVLLLEKGILISDVRMFCRLVRLKRKRRRRKKEKKTFLLSACVVFFNRISERWREAWTEKSSLKGRERAIVNQTNIGTVSKATLGKLLGDRVERIWAFPSQ